MNFRLERIKIFILGIIFLIGLGYFFRIKYKLFGQWQAISVYEENELLDVEINYIKLDFHKNLTYSFNGLLNYCEEGSYRVSQNHLFVRNKLIQNNKERAMEIVLLKDDSLVLKMKTPTEENQIFVLKRIKEQ